MRQRLSELTQINRPSIILWGLLRISGGRVFYAYQMQRVCPEACGQYFDWPT